MLKKAFAIVALITLLALILTGCGSNNKAQSDVSGPPAVTTAVVQKSSLDGSLLVSGKLEGIMTVNVVSKMSGKIAAMNVDVGSVVSAGDVIATLDARELAAAVSQAQAAVAVARSSLQQSSSDFEVAKANYERGQALLREGAISQSDFDNKFALPYKISQERSSGGSEAQLAQAVASLQYAQANYSNSIITAPISGVVTARNVRPGEMASTSVPVVTIVDLSKVIVEANVNESQINKLTVNQPVEVKVAAASGRPFKGEITNIAYAANQSTKAFPIKVQIDNRDNILKAGMFAEVKLSESETPQLVAPKEAVVQSGDGSYVWVLSNNTVAKRTVRTGAGDGKSIVIEDGLTGGEKIVVSGFDGLRDGMAVKPAD